MARKPHLAAMSADDLDRYYVLLLAERSAVLAELALRSNPDYQEETLQMTLDSEQTAAT